MDSKHIHLIIRSLSFPLHSYASCQCCLLLADESPNPQKICENSGNAKPKFPKIKSKTGQVGRDWVDQVREPIPMDGGTGSTTRKGSEWTELLQEVRNRRDVRGKEQNETWKRGLGGSSRIHNRDVQFSSSRCSLACLLACLFVRS